MPVPSSYNDVTTNSTIRDYVGWSWYQYEFYAPKRWADDQFNVFLRFSSVHFKSIVVSIILYYKYCSIIYYKYFNIKRFSVFYLIYELYK